MAVTRQAAPHATANQSPYRPYGVESNGEGTSMAPVKTFAEEVTRAPATILPERATIAANSFVLAKITGRPSETAHNRRFAKSCSVAPRPPGNGSTMAIIAWICLVTAALIRRGSPASQLMNVIQLASANSKGLRVRPIDPAPGRKKSYLVGIRRRFLIAP